MRAELDVVPSPEDLLIAREEGEEPFHQSSLTGAAAEAAQVGIVDPPAMQSIPGQDAILTAGDPDVDPLDNEYGGEQMPGGTNPSPDQNNVDDIGRAYGVTDQDNGALRTPQELLDRRDRHRQEFDPAFKDPQP